MVWRACERFGIKPPTLQGSWDDNEQWNHSLLLAYDQVRTIEEDEKQIAWMKSLMGIK